MALKVFRGYRIDEKVRGVLQFGDGTEDVEYRYVWGRAEYDIRGKGTVKMVRSAQSDGLVVETAGDLPPKFDGEWTLAAKGERGGRTYYDFERKGMAALRAGEGEKALPLIREAGAVGDEAGVETATVQQERGRFSYH